MVAGTADRMLITPQDEARAREALSALKGPDGALLIERGKSQTTMPPELGRILQRIIEIMAAGGTVTIGSTPQELTTSNAAAILGVSRPTVMKMIADGRLTARKVGTHHRLSSDEVVAQLHARRERERAAFLALREELDEE